MGHAAGAGHSTSDNHDLMYSDTVNKVEPITISADTLQKFKNSFFSSLT